MEGGSPLFAVVDSVAQQVDRAFDMAYGVICSTARIAFGGTPTSAVVHAGEVFATATSAGSMPAIAA